MSPFKMLAIVIQGPGEATLEEVSKPILRDNYLIVKVTAVALNPTDWKHVQYLPTKGAVVGCDYAGIVEEVGSAVTKPWKKGDRITGMVHGSNAVSLQDGAFGEYLSAIGDLQIRTPDNITDEEAATLGVGITTVGQALYQSLGLPLPSKPTTEKITILIHGGSSATGALAIQYAKLSGLTVVTTCSPHNYEYVKRLGADAVFDYHSPTCAKDIQKWSSNSIVHSFDCISVDDSPFISVGGMSSTLPGVCTTLNKVSSDVTFSINPKVEIKITLGYTVFGEDFTIGSMEFKANKVDYEFGKLFWEEARVLLEEGKIRVHKVSVNKYGKGLEGIVGGLEAMKAGKVSAEKLVSTL